MMGRRAGNVTPSNDRSRESRSRVIVLTVLTVVTVLSLPAMAPASSSAGNPLKLALQRADMPPTTDKAPSWDPSPHAKRSGDLAILGVPGLKGAGYSYTWAAGGTVASSTGPLEKQWHVSGDVFVAPSPAAAKRLFDLGKRAQIGFFSDFPGQPDKLVPVSLPSYGDQQFGVLAEVPTGTEAMVFVRKAAVVWELRISGNPLKWIRTRAQVLALLKKYAPIQKSRIGPG
jgi:hypothetical protein